jgi:hypothetical protein
MLLKKPIRVIYVHIPPPEAPKREQGESQVPQVLFSFLLEASAIRAEKKGVRTLPQRHCGLDCRGLA